MPPLNEIASMLITGASRGIGLALVKEFAARTTLTRPLIFGGCRDTRNATQFFPVSNQNPNVRLVHLDVVDNSRIVKANMAIYPDIKKDGLGLLINNAGVLSMEKGSRFPDANRMSFMYHFDVNLMGPIMVTEVFLPLLKRHAEVYGSATVINISSGLGSIANSIGSKRTPNGNIAYCLSKVALNHFTKGLAVDVKESGVITAAICPGWVKTEMGGANAEITPAESAKAIVDTLIGLTMEKSGAFLDRFGKPIPY